MCDILDEMKNEARNEGRNEARAETRIETAQKMIKAGKLSYEDIAEYSGLSLDKVRELAGNKSA